jgi:DNA excision repair protein ERCC-4
MNLEDEHLFDLKIDFREQRSGIIDEIKKLSDHLTFEISTLPTGDYWIGNKIIVERKTVSDFIESIKTGRIFQQAYRIGQSGKNGLIIIEGDKRGVQISSMSRKAIQGALIHLTVFLGIPVLRSLNIGETAELLADILHQCQQEELPRPKHILYGSHGIRISKKQRQKLFLLQNIPGIGTKKGLALLRSFSTIENILNASPADLTKVQGIGKKLANRIYTIFHEPF